MPGVWCSGNAAMIEVSGMSGLTPEWGDVRLRGQLDGMGGTSSEARAGMPTPWRASEAPSGSRRPDVDSTRRVRILLGAGSNAPAPRPSAEPGALTAQLPQFRRRVGLLPARVSRTGLRGQATQRWACPATQRSMATPERSCTRIAARDERGSPRLTDLVGRLPGDRKTTIPLMD